MENKKILIIKNLTANLGLPNNELQRSGYILKEVYDLDSALKKLAEGDFPVVFLDTELMEGMIEWNNILPIIKDTYPFIPVIVIASRGTMRSAFEAMRLGAYDYLSEPEDFGKISTVVDQAVNYYQKHRKDSNSQRKSVQPGMSSPIIGESPQLKSISTLIYKIAPTDSTVLIQGETGTGKGLIAEAIHQYSLRDRNPFIVVNCGAIPDNLLESELFGYEKGAFTDATRLKPGLLEAANSGTLFLDEVSELSPKLQAKLLHVVETGRFRRLGSNQEITVDLRIISATNKDLYRECAADKFRKDLYYRLGVVIINIPPLRERIEDIPLLIDFFLDNIKVPGKKRKIISTETIEVLQGYHWAGNVRELRNIVERAVILSEKDLIEVEDLDYLSQNQPTNKQSFLIPPAEKPLTLGQLEKMYIENILKQCRGHRSKAASILGITRHTLYNKIKGYEI